MAIRILAKLTTVCDKCRIDICTYWAFINTEEQRVLANLVSLCKECANPQSKEEK